jgi:rhamnosyltransferase subunit B
MPRVPGAPDLSWLPLPFRRLFMIASDAVMLDPICRADLNRFRRTYGLPPVSHVMTRWMHAPELVVCAFPDWFAPRQPDWPPNSITTGFPVDVPNGSGRLPADLESFLSAGDSPLVFTAGTAMAHARRFFKTALDASAQLSMRAVFACQFPELLPENLPPSVLAVRYAPFSLLFPRVRAVVHHGGIGTCAQALASGVMQLVTPFAHDQFDNAARLKVLGASETASPHADARRWVELIERTMADRRSAEVRENLKERIAGAHAAEEIADRLEKLA